MAVNRVIQQHFSMNYSYMERGEGLARLRGSKSCALACGCEEGEAGEAGELGLSPPAESTLLRRRAAPAELPVH